MMQYLTSKLKEGSVIDFQIDFSSQNGLLSQISKVKAGTRDLAKETGYTFIEMEQLIKKDAGLYDELKNEYKSFANCNFDEMSSAIQVMINMGEECGLNLR